MSRDASHEGDGGDPSLKFTIDLNNFAPFLFEFSRLLSVVPALCGFFFCLWQMLPLGVCGGPPIPGRVDWFVAALWAMLTAYHCLGLSTGLLMRWKLYYSPLATLVRLLGLQGICWPATHLTLSIFGGVRRPVVAWAIVGTSTAVSRSIQIYVTSNIVWLKDKRVSSAASSNPTTTSATIPPDDTDGDGAVDNTGLFNRLAAIIGGDDLMGASSSTIGNGNGDASPQPQPYRRRERRWDWKKVGLRCILPTGLLYFIMAWAEVGRREWESQSGRYCVEFGGAASSGGGCM
ncbi:hypothetical protein FA15DRAFT_589546 [Coprinopsis marcescibilis]|uniref:Uncharacterized protein n=1 Tax=Coprinopsis marcescibilis TaxID=230819 RepID=A0A5C3L0D4_COPMA|nr:hypothetical protein FA15DRAFT_589546 [Coprinopsis marcescibilis]